jgi:hypothetical protein
MSSSSRPRFLTAVALAALLLALPLAVRADPVPPVDPPCYEFNSYFDGQCEVYEIMNWCTRRYCVQLACAPPHGDSETCWDF